jgi:integrase
MFIGNPLRVGQYAVMTYRPDGGGNLVRVGPGRYRVHFQASDFKNEKGAASKPYDVELDPSVTPWIERYLAEARPHLAFASETDRFFLPAVVGPRKAKAFLEQQGMLPDKGWTADGMADRFKKLTFMYIDECPGFGPHACRHIIATDHLRRHPGDYLTVSTLLHDKLETVLKSYGHLRVADGLRVLSKGIQEATEQLAALRNAA